jgi:lipopolysaccharide export LptBFGC system permease protein LptF
MNFLENMFPSFTLSSAIEPCLRKLILACGLVGLFGVIPGSLAFSQTEELRQQDEADTSEFFEKAHDALDEALKMFDDQDHLPGEEDLAFYDFLSRTKESQQKKIEVYLDEAAEALGISDISKRRENIAELRELISETRSELTVYQRKRISAPESTYNPLTVTKSGYDKKIAAARKKIEDAEKEIQAEKARLVEQLNGIGMDLDADTVDILLESITGDEFVRVSIIFENAKQFAMELERLTTQTGEDLEAAKKYYGVYLMLLKTVERLQSKFVENVDNEYYPKLDLYAQQAQTNIKEAERAIRLGGNEDVLMKNIENNRITYDAAMFYKQGLAHQKHQMMMANLECKKNILTAANTYKTAALSKDVATLMSTSRRAFESITSLSVPDLRPFENLKMKEAFGRLTQDLRK